MIGSTSKSFNSQKVKNNAGEVIEYTSTSTVKVWSWLTGLNYN